MVDISTLGINLGQISRIKSQQIQLNDLTTQLVSGKKTQSFKDLGSEAIISKRARAEITSIDRYMDNISNVNRRIEQMDLAMESFQNQTDILLGLMSVQPQQGDYPDFDVIQEAADNVYTFLVELLNIQDGDRYLLAGADSETRPIEDNGLVQSFLGEYVPDETDLTNPPLTASGAVGLWGSGTITNQEFINTYRSIDDTTLGYSSSLTSGNAGRLLARVDDNQKLDYTALANEEGFREILIAVQVLRELPPPEYAPGALNDPTATTFAEDVAPYPPAEKQDNFFAIITDLREMLNTGTEKINNERFSLGQVQYQMDQVKEFFRLEQKLFNDMVSDVEDADMNEVATRITALQVQIEASYSVTALLSQLSLSNFLR